MTKEEMLSAIYDEMADKTLSQGCIITGNICDINGDNIDDTEIERNIFHRISNWKGRFVATNGKTYDKYKIIGHPVLIGDVIEYIRLKNIWDINPITDEWDYPRLSIDEQSDECIEFVYNLIKK